MEDQQPAAGDLTVNDETEAATDAEATEAAATDDAAETTEPAGTTETAEEAQEETTDESDEAAATEAAPEEKKQKKKRTGRRLAAAFALIAALFVGSAAFAGATVQPYLAERATIEVKLKVARAAANAITTLWSYTPENMDSLADRAANYLSGDFGAQYRKFVDQIAAPNKQAKVTNSTEVTGVAVESLDGPNAVAIVYTNTTTTSPLTKNIPALKYLSYRLVMKRDDDRWKVTRMTTVTQLDVTPHL
ncbi:mammalian cell entry protein [Mycobacterium asiaticum]|uniref:Mammalian cell entry protein n=1 Tax=Mycobacterium asiaticum TaxID=1790 RepID=A0A1A3BWM6_MYCAS|nr:mammalian cell entry protein [Mycobacterium asiaticum]OBI79309.1 mammalian cell entry protein [Mycobacterium asiaticum]